VEFRNRADAGGRLGAALAHLRDEDPVVLALPRGGVPVAFEVARSLAAPLDVIVVRKIGAPQQPELAMAAIGEEGARVVNEEVLRQARVTPAELAAVEQAERAEIERRARRFRGGRPRVPLVGRTAVVVDDGVATGATARAACQVAGAAGASRVVLAAPVGPRSAVTELAPVADEVVLLHAPEMFYAVGQWYRDFAQVPDEEVVQLLWRAGGYETAPGTESSRRYHDPDVQGW
jgi:putative phosphoribosyl transferase